ncbi:hypothetical protein Lalb_Chr19g0127431 [Lupinus albus]|uniref:Uncharacterized protein n=1 Tax=Lupinus albus TaxID=3870 RepID=A0A6A4NSW9_LUPAL|nr:hypothetical protein Lalb_Chr19g0127431 [Lupinus albus]
MGNELRGERGQFSLSSFTLGKLGRLEREESNKKWESENTRDAAMIRLLRLHPSLFHHRRLPWFDHVLVPSSFSSLSHFLV